jgi:Flp pilus assembly pilin Flp
MILIMASFFKNHKGQTSVEYILLIAVIASVSIPLGKKLEGYIIGNPNSVVGKMINSYKDMFGGENGGVTLNYKRFSLRR